MKKRAIIVGCLGQDGYLINELLKKYNYEIFGISKKNFDISSNDKIKEILKSFKPDEIYYLAAYHHSSENRKNINLKLNYQVNFYSVLLFLENIKKFSSKTKFFFASSSFIFQPSKIKQNEVTEIGPSCHYSLAKVCSMQACNYYKKNKIFASSGILYNHESRLRQKHFLSKKIVSHAVENYNNSKKKLVLQNLNLKVDWGYAPDYVEAMYKILQQDNPKDYVISSGKIHSVREFVKIAYSSLNLDYTKYVESKSNEDTSVFRLGDPSLIQKNCNWKPSVNFEEMVKLLVEQEIKIK